VTKVAQGRLVAVTPHATSSRVSTERRRVAAEKTSHGNVSGAVPLSSRPDLKSHPATKAPLTWIYDAPSDVGNWIGAIEPEAESWIAFVSTDGKVFLWEKRESNGGVIGVPVTFKRPDIVTNKVTASLHFKCETSPLGANAASGRFRVFREGTTQTDFGLSIVNKKIGAAIIAEFERRGNDMPIDLRHGMLSEKPTLTESEAYGWIPCPGGLEYVDGDGLYARGVTWDPQVKAGLQCIPPKWKYFSPTYDVDPTTRAVLSLTNIALTNLPATHHLNRLAAERGSKMNLAELGMLLAMLSAKADAGDAEAAAMRDKLIAGLGDQVDAALAAAKTDESGPASSDDITAGMSEEDKASYAAMSEPMKAICAAGIKAMKTEAKVDDKKEVAAEKPEDEKIAATISAEQFDLMAKGELVDVMAPRQKIVAELVKKNLLKSGGQAEALLLDPTLDEGAFVKMVAQRRSSTVVIPAKVTPPAEAPSTKGKGLTVQAEQKIGKLAGAFGVNPDEIRKKLQAR